jgi:hypothetical protein
LAKNGVGSTAVKEAVTLAMMSATYWPLTGEARNLN